MNPTALSSSRDPSRNSLSIFEILLSLAIKIKKIDEKQDIFYGDGE
jgi:hypothetical protein